MANKSSGTQNEQLAEFVSMLSDKISDLMLAEAEKREDLNLSLEVLAGALLRTIHLMALSTDDPEGTMQEFNSINKFMWTVLRCNAALAEIEESTREEQ